MLTIVIARRQNNHIKKLRSTDFGGYIYRYTPVATALSSRRSPGGSSQQPEDIITRANFGRRLFKVSMVRQGSMQGDCQVDWVGFMSDVLVIQLHTDVLRSRCIVQMKNAGQSFRNARLKTPFPEKCCNFTKIFIEC